MKMRMRTRRGIAATLMLGVIALPLAACGSDDDSAGTVETSTTVTTSDVAGHGDASPASPGARHIEVSAAAGRFDPADITVTEGEDIAIVLTSADDAHDFTIDEFDAHIPAAARQTGFGGFRAGAPGRYAFYCSVPGHRAAGMTGVITVDPA